MAKKSSEIPANSTEFCYPGSGEQPKGKVSYERYKGGLPSNPAQGGGDKVTGKVPSSGPLPSRVNKAPSGGNYPGESDRVKISFGPAPGSAKQGKKGGY